VSAALPRLAIAQVPMHWTTAQNLAAIEQAMQLARRQGAALCAFSELAVTGFHREIGREAQAQPVQAALEHIARLAAELQLAVAVGAPAFGAAGAILNSHYLLDERGRQAARVDKQGLTEAEATFFARGTQRPVGRLAGLRCSAVICREVSDLAAVQAQLPPGSVDLVLVPGALRQDPEKPRTDPPEYVHEICRLAAATGAHVVQTNWPNALNRPEESVDGGGSCVAAPDGELLFRLPRQAAGLGVFDLGSRQAQWLPWS
jgi:predicted amidohydrolase